MRSRASFRPSRSSGAPPSKSPRASLYQELPLCPLRAAIAAASCEPRRALQCEPLLCAATMCASIASNRTRQHRASQHVRRSQSLFPLLPYLLLQSHVSPVLPSAPREPGSCAQRSASHCDELQRCRSIISKLIAPVAAHVAALGACSHACVRGRAGILPPALGMQPFYSS